MNLARHVAIGVVTVATAGGGFNISLPSTPRRTAGWIVARQVAIGVKTVATAGGGGSGGYPSFDNHDEDAHKKKERVYHGDPPTPSAGFTNRGRS